MSFLHWFYELTRRSRYSLLIVRIGVPFLKNSSNQPFGSYPDVIKERPYIRIYSRHSSICVPTYLCPSTARAVAYPMPGNDSRN
jgi:hypothetical protein